MKQVFDIENYENIKVVMLCPTKENAEDFLEYLQSIGRKWCDGINYNSRETMWDEYKEKTCYAFNEGRYADIDYYTRKNFLVIRFDDFTMPTSELYKIDKDDSVVFEGFMSDFVVI